MSQSRKMNTIVSISHTDVAHYQSSSSNTILGPKRLDAPVELNHET
jgi:hypothetical protein